MKLKEIDRTAMQAWSPARNHPIYLATGTSAQQLDATFSTSASLEIFELDLSDPSLDMRSCATFSASHRYHKLIWGPYKMDSKGDVSGVLIAGGENGNIILYDPSKIIAGDKEVVIAQNDKHTGPVRALDVNIFQTNLVASGANESEIYIWDLNNFATPMTPGAKTQPPEDISCIAWNRQVQHILASASPSGRATVWDLRKNEPIIKVSDHSNRMHCSGLAWHPDVATQMVLASEDDRLPVIQMWDLRFASSPLRVLENHARYRAAAPSARMLKQDWFHLIFNFFFFFFFFSIFVHRFGQILDPFGLGKPPPFPWQIPPASTASPTAPFAAPKKPVGAAFSFGGKLVTFENVRGQSQQGAEQPPKHQVFVSQVVTEREFLSRSDQLQQAVRSQGYAAYCQKKIDASQVEFEKNVWSFLKVNFEDDSRGKYLELLGYRKEDLGKKIALALNKADGPDVALKDSDQVAQSDGEDSHAAEEQLLGERIKEEKQESEFLPPARGTFNISISGDIDGLITQALLTGNFESAVDLCLHDNRMADAIILAIAGGQELLAQTQKKYFAKSQSKITRLITAVVMKNWKEIVESCDLKNWREALAAVLTYAKPDEFSALCERGDSLLQSQACLCYICAGNVERLVACWAKAQDRSHPLSLQDLIEKVVIPAKAVQLTRPRTGRRGALLAEKKSTYCHTPNIVQLRDRLCRAQGEPVPGHASPKVPCEKQQLPKGRLGPIAGHPPMPRVQTQQYYPHVSENPHPGFHMHGNMNPSAAAQRPTSSGSHARQGPPFPQPQRPQNGWNDPPALNRVPKKKKMPENYTPPVPITSPIMHPVGDAPSQVLQQQPAAPVPPPSQPAFPQPHLPPFPGGIQQPLGQAGVPPPAFSKPNIEGAPGAPIGNTVQHVQSLPTEKITKKPIPDEHLILKTTFEDLIQRCLSSATDPQTKRKLDDASKRLEFLYDKLREQT
uniref:Protein transport protein Sec31A n=1 Tax=Microcebus murinus TaxID=30608 RepID=A0A8C5VHC2_MICMU